METETLVEALATDKIVPWTLERSIRLALIAGNIIAGIMFFGGIGFRPDIVFAMGTTRFLVKFTVTLPLALAATAAMLRAAQPCTELLNSDPASIHRASGLSSSRVAQRSLNAARLGRSHRRACRERNCGDLLRNQLHR